MAMWIRQLNVKDCAGIASASVAMQPGLNVLHGPNELGKSTLVRAIRTTLLSPVGSTAADPLRTWNVDRAPSVELTFEQEAQCIWRVRKRFGKSGNHTYLELSRNGREFSQAGSGKGVENQLQNILRWGIEPPGGKGGRRGMPASFITTALLGNQRNIDAVLDASLANDPNASGLEHLTDALQVLAKDPRFKQVQASVQERFNEAFTRKGDKKTAKSAPWSALSVDVGEAERRLQDIQQLVEHSESARSRVAELQQEVLEAEAAAGQATGEFKAAQEAQRQQAERAVAAKVLAAAEDELQRAQAQGRSRDERVAAVAKAEKETETLREQLTTAERDLAIVQRLAKAASERVQQLESGDAEQSRRLREQEAQNRFLKLTQQKAELEARVVAARKIDERETAAKSIQADIEQRTKTLDEQRGLLAAAEAKTAADQRSVEAMERERDCARYRAAAQRLRALTKDRDAARALAKTANTLEDRANEARAKAKELNVPARAEIDELKQLDADRRVAQGKLAVGLALEFTPENTGSAEVTLDGETRTRELNAGEKVRYEAERELRLAIDGVGVLQVRGGGRHLRQEAETAADRWRKYADSLFDRADVETISGLEDKRLEADELLTLADEQDSEATQARVRSEHVEELEQQTVVAKAEAVQRRAAAAKRMAAGVSLDEYIEEHGDLGDEEELAKAIDALKDEVRQRESLRAQLVHEVELGTAQLDGRRQDVARAQQEILDATAQNERWREVLAEAESDQRRLDEERAQVDAEIRAIQSEATAAAEDARLALAKVTQEENAKTQARDEAKQHVQDKENALARLQGEAEAMRTAVEGLDVVGLQGARDESQALLDALPAIDDTPYDLAELERIANDATNNATSLGHELSAAQGALREVGGQSIEEQAAQAKEALAALARREHELEVEYGGWKLLRETLKKAETEDATHLGDALVKPVSERMAALTNGRYSAVGIGPQLNATGIRLGDNERSFNDVSVGTREQIGLLLRLGVAEALGSFVILDDHLTQSDPDRMAWIRGLLNEAAQKIQVVVMTCHPNAYLTGDQSDHVYAVDLTKCIKRHAVGGSAPNDDAP